MQQKKTFREQPSMAMFLKKFGRVLGVLAEEERAAGRRGWFLAVLNKAAIRNCAS